MPTKTETKQSRSCAACVHMNISRAFYPVKSHASYLAAMVSAAGFAILNDVVLNQVLVSFGSADETRRVIAGIQDDGTCWCGGTEWHGHTVRGKRDRDRGTS